MIIQIGTEADESRILWKHNEKDDWHRADIDDLIKAYESRPIRCKDCAWRDKKTANCERFRNGFYVQALSYCSWAERKAE